MSSCETVKEELAEDSIKEKKIHYYQEYKPQAISKSMTMMMCAPSSQQLAPVVFPTTAVITPFIPYPPPGSYPISIPPTIDPTSCAHLISQQSIPCPPASPVMCQPQNQIMPTTQNMWGGSHNYGMKAHWTKSFGELFRKYYPDLWYLTPLSSKPKESGWREFVDSAKVRFYCQKCGHGWTSMKGRVSFWTIQDSHQGILGFKLYGQQCQKCQSGIFENAMWYPEEVRKVLTNIYNRVGQWFYGFQQPPINKVRRQGKPRNPHNAEQCEACQENICSDRNRAIQ